MKTTFQYDHYYDYQELTHCIEQLAKSYPDLVSVESICTSEKGRQVWAVTLTNKKKRSGAFQAGAVYRRQYSCGRGYRFDGRDAYDGCAVHRL